MSTDSSLLEGIELLKCKKVQDNEWFTLKTFCGGGKKRTLITYKGKIVIPKELQQRAIDWYHQQLCHL